MSEWMQTGGGGSEGCGVCVCVSVWREERE